MTFKLESYHHNNGWVKEIKRLWRPELIASLIESRLKTPEKVGPYYSDYPTNPALPSDIVVALAQDSKEVGSKIESASLLLLCDVLADPQKDITFSKRVFALVRDGQFTDCEDFLFDWMEENRNDLFSTDTKQKDLYHEALHCLCRIQSQDKKYEDYWMNLWKDSIETWWGVAFLGLRIQNPETACKELPLFVKRHLLKSHYILKSMWGSLKCRFWFLDALKSGLEESSGWAGLVINELFGVLPDTDKKAFFAALTE